MPHEISSMAFRGQVPWHGLGEQITGATTTQQMLEVAGLDWAVSTAPVKFRVQRDGKNRQGTSQRHKVLIREDTLDVLDVVGPRYVPFQNAEVLEFFHEYVSAGEMKLETAGSLQGGRVIWGLAKMDEAFEVLVPEDRVEGHVLLMNPHQYGRSAVAMFTGIRVVCANTLTAALHGNGGKGQLKLWHTKEFNADMREEAKRRLGIAREQLEAYKADAELLASIQVSDTVAMREIARVMWGDPQQPEPEFQNRRTNRVFDLYKVNGQGSQLESARGTAWGVFNAVTEYMDHHYGRTTDNRLMHSWLGGGAKVKSTVTKNLLALAN